MRCMQSFSVGLGSGHVLNSLLLVQCETVCFKLMDRCYKQTIDLPAPVIWQRDYRFIMSTHACYVAMAIGAVAFVGCYTVKTSPSVSVVIPPNWAHPRASSRAVAAPPSICLRIVGAADGVGPPLVRWPRRVSALTGKCSPVRIFLETCCGKRAQ